MSRSGRKGWAVVVAGLGLGLGAGAAGCGDASGGPPKRTVYPVSGKVVLADGKPLTGGAVYFVPADGALTSEGKVGPDGTFTLVTGGSGEGAPEGEFRVRIEPPEPPASAARRKPNGAGPKPPFAAKYLDEDASGLTARIKAGPNDLPPFVLK